MKWLYINNHPAQKDVYEYKLNLGTMDYFVFLEAGKRNIENKLISIKSSATNTAIPLYQNLIWPMETQVSRAIETYTQTTEKKEKYSGTFCDMQMSEGDRHQMSGYYDYNAEDKKVTFALILTNGQTSGSVSTMTKIVLGISEDNDWGNDLLISCDTHRHISALGEIKVVIRSLFRSA